MKPLTHTKLGKLFKTNPVAHYLYLATKAAHDSGNHARRDQIRSTMTEDEKRAVSEIGVDKPYTPR